MDTLLFQEAEYPRYLENALALVHATERETDIDHRRCHGSNLLSAE
jgi:hypothetical protein